MKRIDWVLVSEPPDRWLCFECYRRSALPVPQVSYTRGTGHAQAWITLK